MSLRRFVHASMLRQYPLRRQWRHSARFSLADPMLIENKLQLLSRRKSADVLVLVEKESLARRTATSRLNAPRPMSSKPNQRTRREAMVTTSPERSARQDQTGMKTSRGEKRKGPAPNTSDPPKAMRRTMRRRMSNLHATAPPAMMRTLFTVHGNPAQAARQESVKPSLGRSTRMEAPIRGPWTKPFAQPP